MKTPALFLLCITCLISIPFSLAKSTELTKVFKHTALSKLHKQQEYYADKNTILKQKYLHLEDEIDTLEKQFNGKYAYKNIKLMFKLQHIFDITTDIHGRYSGFHHDYLDFYYQQGLLKKIGNSYKHGCYQAIPIWCAYKNAKSFFPADWPRKKVIEHILESIDNATHEDEQVNRNRIAITAQAQQGMHIRTIIERGTGQIITAFPLM